MYYMNYKTEFLNLLIITGLLLGGCSSPRVPTEAGPNNLILLISDGCGPASFTMTREYKRLVQGNGTLAFDPYLIGTVQTYPADVRIADSAASATAYACGVKTNKGAVAVDAAGQPVGTLLEAAESRGMWTGIISTSGITDATPAAFSSHHVNRDQQTELAVDQIHHEIEVLLGGGRIYYSTWDNGGVREDGEDLIDLARDLGYQYVSNRDELLDLVHLPLLGLFADDHMAFEIDRDETTEPSLSEMLTVALGLLSESKTGFILIVETEGTDDTGHGNDPAGNLREVLSFEETVRLALEFAKEDGETLVVSTSDHDSGGMSVGRGGYEWWPEILTPVNVSADRFGDILRDKLENVSTPRELSNFVRSEMDDLFGFSDLSEEQWDQIDATIGFAFNDDVKGDPMRSIANLIKEETSRRSGIGWITGSHTGVDVNLYAYGPGSLRFRGNLDNAVVGRTLADVMNLDLDAETERLRN